MLGAYVCRQCRVRLAQRAHPLRTPQLHPRATFLSLRREPTAANGESAAEKRLSRTREEELAQEIPHDRPRIHYTNADRPEQINRLGRYSRHVRLDGDRTQSGTTYQSQTVETRNDNQALERPPDTADSHAQNIVNALNKRQIAQAWRLFEQTYTSKDCEALKEPSLGDIELLNQGKVFLHLLNSINAAFCKGHNTQLGITPTTVLFKYEQLGVARPDFWGRQTIAYLTHQVIQAVNATTDQPRRDLPSLLFELLSVWRLFFQCMGRGGDALGSISTEWHLPALEVMPDVYDHKDFSMRLQEYHPKYIGNPTLGFCAVYLYSISDALNANESLREQAAPLLQFFGRLLVSSHVNSVFKHTEQYSNAFKALPKEVQQQIVQEVDTAPQRAMVMFGSSGKHLGSENPGDAAANLESFYIKRISRAVESRSSPAALESLWKQVEKAYVPKAEYTTIPPRIYNAFLSAYLILLTPQRSVEVWNHMIANGVKPDLQSWVALLEGCARAKDLDGFNTMWTRMLTTGVEPDNHAWTSRVNGLVSLRQVNLGLAALDEMGRRWLSAENSIQTQTHGKNRQGAKNLPASSKAVNRCTKPSIEVVNGAISALVQIRSESMRHDKRVDFVQKILGWARNFAIKPDARTYNSLIQLYLKAGDSGTAYKILRQMEVDGLHGDIATHTMLVSAAFDNQRFDGLSAAEQTDYIISLFNDLETSGLKLNDYIYSTAIDRLLKRHSNFDAVRALIDHMTSRSLVPSAPVYTSLITHYFAQTPPAISAVDAVVHQVFTSHRVPSDRVLFDRLIEGYARHAEVGKMMSVLTRMSKHGKLPGWSALTAVVEALVEDGDTERARAVVRGIERGEGIAQGGITGVAQGERAFFAMVRGFGIGLEEERMGELWRDDRAVRASSDEVVLGRQLREQEIEQITGSEEAQEGGDVEPGSVRSEEGGHA